MEYSREHLQDIGLAMFNRYATQRRNMIYETKSSYVDTSSGEWHHFTARLTKMYLFQDMGSWIDSNQLLHVQRGWDTAFNIARKLLYSRVLAIAQGDLYHDVVMVIVKHLMRLTYFPIITTGAIKEVNEDYDD